MQKLTDSINRVRLTLPLLIVLMTPFAVQAASVSGRYLRASGTTITLEIVVNKPAPSSIIVEQFFAPENKIKTARPQPQKIDIHRSAKWLVKNLRPGKRRFSVQLTAPLQGSVRGVVRYKDPMSGTFLETNIAP